MSKTIDDDNSSCTDDLSNLGPLNYIPSLTNIDEEDNYFEGYLEHDMLGEFLVSLSRNLLGATTEGAKQFVVIHALKQRSIFQKGHDDIE
jgi:hypothetical protein